MQKLFLTMMLMVTLCSCSCAVQYDDEVDSDVVVETAYKALSTGVTLYDSVMQATSEMYSRGVLNDEQYTNIRARAMVFYDVYTETLDLLSKYVSTKKDSAALLENIFKTREALALLVDGFNQMSKAGEVK